MKSTKEIILKTAYNLFLYNNYEAVTLNSIIKETGLSKGAIYHYYASKEDIFKAVVDEYMVKNCVEPSVETFTLKQLIDNAIETAQTKVSELAAKNPNFHNEIPINYLSLLVTAFRYYPGFEEVGPVFFKKQLEKWEYVIKNAIANGEIRNDIDIEATIANFIQAGSGVVTNMMIGGSIGYALEMLERQYRELYKSLKI
jgi:AcrR family transcriptional regulator